MGQAYRRGAEAFGGSGECGWEMAKRGVQWKGVGFMGIMSLWCFLTCEDIFEMWCH